MLLQRRLLIHLSALLVLQLSCITGEIISTNRFADICHGLEKDTLILVDVDYTLIESKMTLGNSPWNQYIKKRIQEGHYTHENLFELMAFWLAHQVPVRAVESSIPHLIDTLNRDYAILGFTARGKTKWYDSDLKNIDLFTHDQLTTANIHLRHTWPQEFHPLAPESAFAPSYGILFTSQTPKGDFLEKLLPSLANSPKKIVFIDDNKEQLLSVEASLKETEVAFLGYHYTLVENQAHLFDPLIGIIQLQALVHKNQLLSDAQAELEKHTFPTDEAQAILDNLLEHFDTVIIPAACYQ